MDDSLPLEISEACESFHLSLAEIESLLRETPYDAVDHEVNRDSLEIVLLNIVDEIIE